MRANPILTYAIVLVSMVGLCASGGGKPTPRQASEPSVVVLLATGNYQELPVDMSPSSLPLKNWIAIPIGSCEMLSTDIILTPQSGMGFEVAVAENETMSARLLYGLQLEPGKFECSDLVRVGTHTVAFMGKDSLGNPWAYHDYQFKNNLISVYPELAGGQIDLVLKVNGESQALRRYKIGEIFDVGITCLGDLDRDGKVDLILGIEQGGRLQPYATILYLSGQAKRGEFVKEVAAMYQTPA